MNTHTYHNPEQLSLTYSSANNIYSQQSQHQELSFGSSREHPHSVHRTQNPENNHPRRYSEFSNPSFDPRTISHNQTLPDGYSFKYQSNNPQPLHSQRGPDSSSLNHVCRANSLPQTNPNLLNLTPEIAFSSGQPLPNTAEKEKKKSTYGSSSANNSRPQSPPNLIRTPGQSSQIEF